MSSDPAGAVRPYVMTGGRTDVDGSNVRIETMVVTIADREEVDRLVFEHSAVAEACETALSVAEIAVAVGIPLGVARVIVADLGNDGIVELSDVTDEETRDIAFLQRLIDGVRSL
ncbi:MAG: DUF742 domain-containing protein [Acidimicrobiia bacterium]